jgi:hypothetical protein
MAVIADASLEQWPRTVSFHQAASFWKCVLSCVLFQFSTNMQTATLGGASDVLVTMVTRCFAAYAVPLLGEQLALFSRGAAFVYATRWQDAVASILHNRLFPFCVSEFCCGWPPGFVSFRVGVVGITW